MNHFQAVNQHRDAVALDDDFLRVPHIVLGWRCGDVHQAIEAAGADPIGVTVVDLALETTLRPAVRLILRMEVNPAV